MTETEHWQALKGMLGKRIYSLKLNVSYVAGVPDCWLSGTLDDLWMENKRLKEIPATIDCNKLLSVLQKAWLLDRHAEGRNVSVLVFSPEGHVFFDKLTWLEPVTREEFLGLAMKRRAIANMLVEKLGETFVATEGLRDI